ncbi:MAG: SH3 domain-containing protein [Planctomycetota bacterium]|jgi:uncharacterized protein YgiM (DUF1202 family)
MLARTYLFGVVCLALGASVCFGQVPESDPVIEAPADTAKSEAASFPYVAEITGTDVYIRSGPGTAYYYCGKLTAPARVIVTGEKHGWLQILPPAGSFSWISKNYVKLDPDNPGIGIVTGDSVRAVRSVRVWAGSDYVEPMRSHSLQAKLNEGDQVKLAGDESEKGDYYKILPPPGAHLWVSAQYAKYVGPVPKPKPLKLPPRPEPAPEVKPEPKADVTVKPTAPKVIQKPKPVIVPKKTSAETIRLKECYELAKQIEAELSTPIAKQDYGTIKKKLNAIINDPQAGKAKLYAEYQLDRVGRFEMALQVSGEVKGQDAKLQKLREQIKNRYAVKAANIPDPGKFIAAGRLRPSQIYTTQTGQKRYLVVDETGKIMCYAMPADSASGLNMDKFIGRKVGLLGQAVKDPYNAVSLVKFTEIVDLQG